MALTMSSRRPSSSSSPAEDEKKSSWPTSWWIGGGVAGTLTVIILVCIICKCLPSSEAKKSLGIEAPPAAKTIAQVVPQTQAKKSLGIEAPPAAKTIAPVPQTQAKVQPKWPCPSGTDKDCADDAVCVKDGGTNSCQTLPGATCIHDECYESTCADSESGQTTICQVEPDAQEVFPPNYFCNDGFVLVGKFCKAKIGTDCTSPRTPPTPMQWCTEGSTCQRKGEDWTCQATATNNASANIQLGESTDTWLLINASLSKSEAYAGKASNLRRKRTRSLDASSLQLDAP